jgi:serine/threonine-protein kinase
MKIITGHGNEVKVPNIIGVNFDTARNRSKKLKLYVQKVDSKHSNDVAKGKVLSQSPNPGIMTKISRTIEVTVSEGPELVRVPFLDNITSREAKVRLKNTALKLGEIEYRYSEDVKKGKIIISTPIADAQIPKYSDVNVIVSLGKVPNTTKKSNKYKNLLDKAGSN